MEGLRNGAVEILGVASHRLTFAGEVRWLPVGECADSATDCSGDKPLLCLFGLGKRGLRRNVSL